MIYKVTNIDYDTDGENVELPESLDITVPDEIEDHYEINEFISDEISNQTGFCHNGYSVTPELVF